MNRFALPLVVVSLVIAGCLGGWAVWEHLENQRLTGQVTDLEELLTKAKAEIRPEVAAAPASRGGRNAPPVRSSADTSSPESGDPSKSADAGKSMAAGLAKMMENPKMRDAFKAQARLQIGAMYHDLFDLLDLQEPKRSELEKLVSEKAAAGMEVGFSMFGSKKSPEEMRKVSADLKAQMKDYDSKIKDLLGEEDFNKVKRFEDSANERMHLKTFTGMLESAKLDIDEATESKLMDVMYDERKNFPFAAQFGSQQNLDMARFTPENVSRFGDEYSQLNQNVVNRASGILTPQQLDIFKQSQEQMGTMIKMHIEMAGQMFGGGQPSKP